MVTNSFSLQGYSAGDSPTLYFNYLLQTENANSTTAMKDSARVFVSTDNGVTWNEVATNNSILSSPTAIAELPTYITPSSGENLANATNTLGASRVQELYDTTSWRQARVDLSTFTGQPNIKLRFDFSTSGTTYQDTGT